MPACIGLATLPARPFHEIVVELIAQTKRLELALLAYRMAAQQLAGCDLSDWSEADVTVTSP